MKTRGLLGMIGLALSVAAAPITLANEQRPGGTIDPDKFVLREKRGKGQHNRRGNGKRNPPRSHPNKLTISRRVRRKHRRAKAA